MTKKQRSALKLALSEFAVVFLAAVCWNLFRKTGESTLDALALAALTAVFLYFLHSD